jgi:hypothetical protein
LRECGGRDEPGLNIAKEIKCQSPKYPLWEAFPSTQGRAEEIDWDLLAKAFRLWIFARTSKQDYNLLMLLSCGFFKVKKPRQ